MSNHKLLGKLGCFLLVSFVFKDLQLGQVKTAPLLNKTIEMRVFWTEIKYLKKAARLLDRDCVNRRGLYLSKKVLWISVSWRAAELLAVKVED